MPLATRIKQIAESKRLANWLSRHYVLGNIAFTLLVSYSLYNIVEGFLPQFAVSGYEQKRITKSHMEAVCRNKDFYQKKLRQRYDLAKDDIRPQGVKYRKDVVEVYPVFRWSCKYEIMKKVDSPDNEPPSLSGSGVSSEKVYTGLSLDEYHCEVYFGDLRLTKSTYLNPKDPSSWYCTNANPEL